MSKDHEVLFETDGRHSSVYLYAPPMDERKYGEPIDEVLDLGVDTIIYVVGDCSVLLYDTVAGERWGHNVDLTDHAVFWRAAQNCASFIEQGFDPLRVVCDHAHRRGCQFLPHLILNMYHVDHGRVTNCRVADFTSEHPEWQIGPEPDYPASQYDRPNMLSYAYAEVRANRLSVIDELVGRYPTDGIEVNFYTYAPYIGRGQVAEHTQTLTDWVREIRATCAKAASEQGRSKRLVVRVAATLLGNLSMGMDVAGWITQGLVDTVIAMPVGDGFEAQTDGLREIVAAAEGTDVKVLFGQNSVASDQSREVHQAAAVNAYAAGAQGVLYHRYYPLPNRYPYDAEMIGRIRFMGYPDLLTHMDKSFRLGEGGDRHEAAQHGLKEQIPVELASDEEGPEFIIEVADDIAAKAEQGELWSCELRVMLDYMMDGDEIRAVWNGKEVPTDIQRWADWILQMRPRPGHVRGYRMHVNLRDDWLPRVGKNTLRIDVLKKDPQLIQPITISEVDIDVKYLPHRNGLRPDEKYSSGATFTP